MSYNDVKKNLANYTEATKCSPMDGRADDTRHFPSLLTVIPPPDLSDLCYTAHRNCSYSETKEISPWMLGITKLEIPHILSSVAFPAGHLSTSHLRKLSVFHQYQRSCEYIGYKTGEEHRGIY
jgi:hypothetical protein